MLLLGEAFITYLLVDLSKAYTGRRVYALGVLGQLLKAIG